MKRVLFAVLLAACSSSQPNSSSAGSTATPKEAVTGYVDALFEGRCRDAYARVGGPLRDTYERMIESRGMDYACQVWRDSLIPNKRAAFTYEEPAGADVLVWMRMFRSETEFVPQSFRAAKFEGGWLVVGL